MIVLASVVAIISTLIIAMLLTARKNTKERNKRMIKYWRETQRTSRLYKWREKYSKWKEELKKPVKVQFD